MENAINTLRIQNFKSIKDVTLQPRRVNLIIGPPNVGKSNILEAMSLLGAMALEPTKKFMGSYIRYEEPRNIFYDNIVKNSVRITTDKYVSLLAKIRWDDDIYSLFMEKDAINKIVRLPPGVPDEEKTEVIISQFKSLIDTVNKGGARKGVDDPYVFSEIKLSEKKNDNVPFTVGMGGAVDRHGLNLVKYYSFTKQNVFEDEYYKMHLKPPHGANLVEVIQNFSKFRKEIARMFDPYGLKLLLRIDERRIEVVKDLDGVIYSYPYSSIADTLQRIIFYLAAIESNDDAVILFEEPEAHSYPQYVSMLGKRIAASRNNQFFVATHSPYLLTEILEQMLPDEEQAPELAIFVAYYEDYQTKVKQLSDEEMRAIRGDSVDVFYNMNRYIPRPANG